MTELTEQIKTVKQDSRRMAQMVAYIGETMEIKIKENETEIK